MFIRTPPAGYKNNKNTGDVPDDYVSIKVGEDVAPPLPPIDPEDGSTEEQIAELWEAMATMQQSQKADHDRIAELTANLHQA